LLPPFVHAQRLRCLDVGEGPKVVVAALEVGRHRSLVPDPQGPHLAALQPPRRAAAAHPVRVQVVLQAAFRRAHGEHVLAVREVRAREPLAHPRLHLHAVLPAPPLRMPAENPDVGLGRRRPSVGADGEPQAPADLHEAEDVARPALHGQRRGERDALVLVVERHDPLGALGDPVRGAVDGDEAGVDAARGGRAAGEVDGDVAPRPRGGGARVPQREHLQRGEAARDVGAAREVQYPVPPRHGVEPEAVRLAAAVAAPGPAGAVGDGQRRDAQRLAGGRVEQRDGAAGPGVVAQAHEPVARADHGHVDALRPVVGVGADSPHLPAPTGAEVVVVDDVHRCGREAGEAREHRGLVALRRRPLVDDGTPVPAHEAEQALAARRQAQQDLHEGVRGEAPPCGAQLVHCSCRFAVARRRRCRHRRRRRCHWEC